jgi:hypothetical protein
MAGMSGKRRHFIFVQLGLSRVTGARSTEKRMINVLCLRRKCSVSYSAISHNHS